jgi:hypothetical protein
LKLAVSNLSSRPLVRHSSPRPEPHQRNIYCDPQL